MRELIRLSACWEVKAGVLPGKPEEEYTKKFFYTSGDREADDTLPENTKTNRFTEKMHEAHHYAKCITNPSRVNWVSVEFIWF